MKTPFSHLFYCVIWCGLCGVRAFAGTVVETPTHFIGPLDGTNDWAVVEKNDGTVTLLSAVLGVVTEQAAIESGVEQIQDIATGARTPSGAAVLLASTVENRFASVRVNGEIGLVGATGTGAGGVGELTKAPGGVLLPILGSAARPPAKPGEIPSNNGWVESPFSLVPGSAPGAQAEVGGGVVGIQPQPVGSETLALVLTEIGVDRILRMMRRTPPGFDTLDTLSGLDLETRVLPGLTDSNGDAVVLLWVPGSKDVISVRIDLSGPNPAFEARVVSAPFTLGGASAVSVPGLTDGVLLVADDFVSATSATIGPNGKFLNLVPFSPPAGDFFNGVAGLPGQGMLVLSSKTAGGVPNQFSVQSYDAGAASWSESQAPSALTTAGSSGLNTSPTVFFFDGDPVDGAGRLIGGATVGDWTRPDASGSAVPARVGRESYIDGAIGLAYGDDEEAIAVPAGTDRAMPNQFRPDVSVAAISGQSLPVPKLFVRPPSGDYSRPVVVRVAYDPTETEIRFRYMHDQIWRPVNGDFAVGYPATLEFVAVDAVSGVQSAVVSRSYAFPGVDPATMDSDGDGVPDFVEADMFLNPLAGPDSDLDGRSDLAEILDGSDPADSGSLPNSGFEPFVGQGFRLSVMVLDNVGRHFSEDEKVYAETLRGETLDVGVSLAQSTNPNFTPSAGVAELESFRDIPDTGLLVLRTNPRFDTAGGDTGVEAVRLLPPPRQAYPEIGFVAGGVDPAADAEGWRTAAQAAGFTGYHPAEGLTYVEARHTLVTVAVEEILHRRLANATGRLQPPLVGDLPARDLFTIVPRRSRDRGRTAPTSNQLAVVAAEGLRLGDLVAELQQATDGASPEYPNLVNLTISLYGDYLTNGAADPNYPLPLDSLRSFLHGTSPRELPPTVVLSGPLLAQADAEVDAFLALDAGLIRPTTDPAWTLRVPTSPAEANQFVRTTDDVLVELVGANGGPFLLDQGFGVSPGAEFEVFGYTDVAVPSGLPAIEVLQVRMLSVVLTSASDTDGNLLDDQWEEFYFGTTGLDPHASPAGSAHSYLQYFLEGADPRQGAPLPVAPLDLSRPALAIQISQGGVNLETNWPARYFDLFELELSVSTNLSDFNPVVWEPEVDANGLIVFPEFARIEAMEFYRVTIRLR